MSLVKNNEDENKLQLALPKNILIRSNLRRKVNVLDEETYITKLESIIEKCFFPDLEKIKVQQAYSEAVKNNDFDTLRELYSKYNHLLKSKNDHNLNQTPGILLETPNVTQAKKPAEKSFINPEPPGLADSNDSTKSKETKIESLDNFLAKNTSEDNVSFEGILHESEKRENAKVHNAWLHEKEKQLKLQSSSNLMIENETGNNTDVTKSLDSWTYTTKNTLMYVPEGSPLSSEEMLNKAKKVRLINHVNTRFTPQALATLYRIQTNSKASASNSEPLPHQIPNVLAKVGIDGKDNMPKESPKVKGYSFVEPSPSPMPGRMNGDESPMMTWGEIDSTPMRLDPSDTPLPNFAGAPEFKMPDIPERERLALDLEEKASAERRRKKNEALKNVQRNLISPSRISSTNSPYMSDRINSMSPAAQKLLSAKLSLKSDKLGFGGNSMPTPSPSSVKTTAQSPHMQYFSSPVTKSSSANLRSTVKRSSDSMTDNLLKLPKHS